MRTCVPIFSILLLGLLSGCIPHRELVTFDEADLPDGMQDNIKFPVAVQIQPNDLLRIQVQSIDAEADAPFNPASGGQTGLQLTDENVQLFRGYLVDQDGFLDLPVIGRLEVKGQTIESLQAILRGKLKTYFRTTPLVNIRYLNFKATLLGEVTRPGVISMPNTRVTLLEALGMAGDLTPYANRRNVLLIREKDGKRTYARIDLHQDDLLSSPYYYLQQNDLIYVEPLRARTATVADRGQRVISYGTAVLSLAALVLTLTQR